MSWVEKYKPRTLKEVKISPSKLMQLKQSVLEKKPLIIHGNTGVGKTSTIYALANDLNYEVVEINATDLRNKNNVNFIIGHASQQRSLFKEGKILLIDEVDALTGIDRGGATTILSIMKKTRTPIILTANNPYDSKLSSIRRKCRLIEFEDIEVYGILEILKKILNQEGINCKENLLLEIAKQSKGDLRAAINDLQVNAIGKKEINDLFYSEREKKEDIFKVLRTIFNKRNVNGIADKLDMDYDELLLWIEENLPKEYKGESLATAFNALSKADIFRSRIRKKQYWRLLVYIRDLLTHGIALAKPHENDKFTSYKRGQRILKYWIYKQKNAKKKEIAKKLAKYIHISSNKAMNELKYLGIAIKNNKEIQKELKLSTDEITWLKQ